MSDSIFIKSLESRTGQEVRLSKKQRKRSLKRLEQVAVEKANRKIERNWLKLKGEKERKDAEFKRYASSLIQRPSVEQIQDVNSWKK